MKKNGFYALLDKNYVFGKEPGPWSTKLYNALRAIQLGEAEDKHNWNTIVE